MNKQTAYISGAITDNPNAIIEFKNAEQSISEDYEVNNPLEICPAYHAASWVEYMEILIPYIVKSDVVFTLPNWKKSVGARLEVAFAHALNIPVKSLDYSTIQIQLATDSVEQLMRKYCDLLEYNYIDIIKNRSQKSEIIIKRQLFMYIANIVYKHSYNSLARFYKMDHTTIMNSVKRVQDDLDVNSKLRQAYNYIIKEMEK